jgi:dihydropteroate synthase
MTGDAQAATAPGRARQLPAAALLPVVPGLPAPGRCLVMGVVNVTPDSFSDGGEWFAADAAISRGLELAAQGADIIDVGGESTRPGAGRTSAAEELRRVRPVITELAAAGLTVSIDTMRTAVAETALAAGAKLVNDVSGGLADPAMHSLVASAGVPYVVMHWRGHSAAMRDSARYGDVVREVCDELRQRADAAVGAGIDPSLIVIDPGIGFAKLPEHNWALLAGLPEIARLGGSGPPFPVLVGASRKSFLGRLLAAGDGTPRPFTGSDDATIALTALAAAAGAWCTRVHAVAGNADAVRVAAQWQRAEQGSPARQPGIPEPESPRRKSPEPDGGGPG